MPSAGVDGCCSTLYYHVKIQCNHLLERFRFPPDKKYGAYFLFHQELGTLTAPKLVFIGLLTVIMLGLTTQATDVTWNPTENLIFLNQQTEEDETPEANY